MTLYLFWISTCVGAALFFALGVAIAEHLRRDLAGATSTAPGDNYQPQDQLLEAQFRRDRDGWNVDRVQLEERLADLNDALGSAEIEHDAVLRELARLRRQREADERSARSCQALETQVREQQSQLTIMQKRLAEAQASREDYIRLRTRRDENQFLRSEIARLKAELVEAHTGGGMLARRPARPRSVAQNIGQNKLSLSAALDRAVEALIEEREGSIVLADEVGFPVTHTDDHGAALAAFSSLLTSAGDRAHTFAPVGRTRMISIVDEGGAQISIWPFDQGDTRLSLVTLSRSPLEDARVTETLAQISALLDRPRPGEFDGLEGAATIVTGRQVESR